MSEVIQAVWSSLTVIHGELIGLAFTLLGAFVVYLFRPKVNLVYGRANNSLNQITVPDLKDNKKSTSTEIYVEKFFLQNLGRKPASNVEFVLSNYPNDISVWQPRDVTYKTVEKNNCLIGIPQIAPYELVTIDCVYLNKQAAYIASVKCAETLGKEISFWTVRRFSSWVNGLIFVFLVLGVAFVLQTIVKLIGGL